MSFNSFSSESLSESLEALRAQKEGGIFSALAPTDPSETYPWAACFFVRTPMDAEEIRQVPLHMSLRTLKYPQEGPLVVIDLKFYDRAGQGSVKMQSLPRGLGTQLEIVPASPFCLQHFLHPSALQDREVLRSLAQQALRIQFYGTDPNMTYQVTRRYPISSEFRDGVKRALAETEGCFSSDEQFLAAIANFEKEYPLGG